MLNKTLTVVNPSGLTFKTSRRIISDRNEVQMRCNH